MTRKDYQLIARALKQASENWEGFDEENPQVVITAISAYLARELAQDNPRFDRTRFLEACGLEVHNSREWVK